MQTIQKTGPDRGTKSSKCRFLSLCPNSSGFNEIGTKVHDVTHFCPDVPISCHRGTQGQNSVTYAVSVPRNDINIADNTVISQRVISQPLSFSVYNLYYQRHSAGHFQPTLSYGESIYVRCPDLGSSSPHRTGYTNMRCFRWGWQARPTSNPTGREASSAGPCPWRADTAKQNSLRQC